MKITLDTVIKRSDELVHSDMDGETVMMSIEQSQYYGLDSVGTRIWDLIEDQMRVSDICAALMNEYDVTEQQCQQDVISFLQDMLENNTVVTR